jgi:hypothetical protein
MKKILFIIVLSIIPLTTFAAVSLAPDAYGTAGGINNGVFLDLTHGENKLICYINYDLFGLPFNPANFEIKWNGTEVMTNIANSTTSLLGTDYFGSGIWELNNPTPANSSTSYTYIGTGNHSNMYCAGFSGVSEITIVSSSVFSATPTLNYPVNGTNGYILDNYATNALINSGNSPQNYILDSASLTQANLGYSFSTSTISQTGWDITGGSISQFQGIFLSGNEAQPLISFIWPQDGTSTPPITKWSIKLNVNSADIKYPTFTIAYATSSGRLAAPFVSTGVYFDYYPKTNQSPVGTAGFLDLTYIIPRRQQTFYQGQTWYARIIYSDKDQSGQNERNITTPIISFNIDNGAEIPISYFTNSTTTLDQQSAQNIIQSILYGVIPSYQTTIFPAGATSSAINTICSETPSSTTGLIIAGLFCPTDLSTTFIQDQFNSYTNTFPLSVFSNLSQSLQNVSSSYNNTNGTIKIKIFGYNTTLMSSSTLANIIGIDNKKMFFDFQGAIIWSLVGFEILAIIYRHFHKNA